MVYNVYAKQKKPGVQGQEEPATKSSEAKKSVNELRSNLKLYQLEPRSLYLAYYLLLIFTSKACNNLQGVFQP